MCCAPSSSLIAPLCLGLSDLPLQVHTRGDGIVCTAVLSLALSKQPSVAVPSASAGACLKPCLSMSAAVMQQAAS